MGTARGCIDPIHAAFIDGHAVIEIEFADANWVAATGMVTGPHLGPDLEMKPSGTPIATRFPELQPVNDGEIEDNGLMIDNVDVMPQLGFDRLAMVPRVGPQG